MILSNGWKFTDRHKGIHPLIYQFITFISFLLLVKQATDFTIVWNSALLFLHNELIDLYFLISAIACSTQTLYCIFSFLPVLLSLTQRLFSCWLDPHPTLRTLVLRNCPLKRVKNCLHQPCDIYFLANSYDLNRKPTAGKSQRLNTIFRDRTSAVRCSYDRRTTVIRALQNCRCAESEFVRQPYEFVRQPYKFAKLVCECRTNCTNLYAAIRLPYVVRTFSVRARSMLFHACFFAYQRFSCPFDFSFLLFLCSMLSIWWFEVYWK